MEETVTQEKQEQIPVLQSPSISATEFVKLRRGLGSLRDKKERLFEIRSVISQEIKDLFAELKKLKEERDQMTEKVKTLKGEREKINTSIKGKIGEVKEIKTPSSGQPQEHINTVQLKAEIKRMQYFIETNPLSPEEEKKVMKNIRDKEKLLDKAKKTTEVVGQKKEVSGQIDELKDTSNKVHAEIQDTAAQSQVRHEKIITISKDIKFLKAREKDVHALFTQVKEEYKGQKLTFLQNRSFYAPKQRDQQSSHEDRADREEKMLQKRVDEVEHKIKTKQKLTTEDLLAFRGGSGDK